MKHPKLVAVTRSTTTPPEVTPSCTFAIMALVETSSDQILMKRVVLLAALTGSLTPGNTLVFVVSILYIQILFSYFCLNYDYFVVQLPNKISVTNNTFLLAAASYTATSSYQTVDNLNTNGFISNAIPDSTVEAPGYNFQFYKQFNNQYQYHYQQPRAFYHAETSTFRPLISIFKTASNLFAKPKSTGFRIGTVYV